MWYTLMCFCCSYFDGQKSVCIEINDKMKNEMNICQVTFVINKKQHDKFRHKEPAYRHSIFVQNRN